MKIKLLTLLLCTTIGNAQCWSTVATGYSFTIAKTPQGKLYTAGSNNYGQLGNGTSGTGTESSTFQLVGTDTWSTMAAGDYHALAIKANGTLWAWGNNSQGALGDGTNVGKTNPIQIGTATDWASVTAGYGFSLAIKTDGTLWAWGENLYGELGIGTHGPAADTNFPQQVGTDTDWRMVSAGSQHTMAIKNNGTLWVWGRNEVGELGLGFNQIPKYIPTQLGTSANWETIAAGEYCSAAIKTDHSLWTWGDNSAGAIGDNTSTDRVSPVRIGITGSWEKVSNGYHMVAIQSNGTIWSWGSNLFGQVGNNSFINRRTPIQISSNTNWQFIAASANATLAINSNGDLYGIGLNIGGQLGDGTTTDHSVLTLSTCPTLGIQESETAVATYVYPNPARDKIYITNTNGQTIKHIIIHDLTGKQLGEQRENLGEVNISSLSPGIYFLTVFYADGSKMFRLVKE
ncbi:MAG: T9SS type A sorting domain-containing protein [Flavobacterium sp.]|nr:T9SS type A sorting domain-containing protein [Flavobacterium sp.]